MGSKYVVGKHPASSPIDEDQTNKKQREHSVNSEDNLTVSPNNPTTNENEIQNSIGINTNTNTQNPTVQQPDTSQGNTAESPVISGVENHVLPSQSQIANNDS